MNTKMYAAVLTWFIMLALNGLVIMWMWNWLMVAKFGLPTVTYVEGVTIWFTTQVVRQGITVKLEIN